MATNDINLESNWTTLQKIAFKILLRLLYNSGDTTGLEMVSGPVLYPLVFC